VELAGHDALSLSIMVSLSIAFEPVNHIFRKPEVPPGQAFSFLLRMFSRPTPGCLRSLSLLIVILNTCDPASMSLTLKPTARDVEFQHPGMLTKFLDPSKHLNCTL